MTAAVAAISVAAKIWSRVVERSADSVSLSVILSCRETFYTWHFLAMCFL